MIRTSRRARTVALAAAPVVLVTAVVSAAASGVGAVTGQATTVVFGDTFEDGGRGAWAAKAAQKLTLRVVDGGASATPGKALQVTGVRKVKVGPKRVVDTSSLVKGQWYRVTGSVRVPGAQTPVMVDVVPQQSFADSVTYTGRTSGDWTSAGSAFVWPGKGKLVLTVKFSAGCPGDVVPSGFLLDDVTLTALSGQPPVPGQIACTSPTTTSPTRTTPTTTSPTTTSPTTSPTTTSPTPTRTTPTTPPSSYPNPGLVLGDTAAHDPTVVKRPDGTYLVATTGRGIPLKVSKDRTTWTAIGSAFPDGAPWTSTYTSGDLWAPDLTYVNGLYYLYYAASTFGSSTSAIYLAVSTTGEPGTWSNRGIVVNSTASSGWNAIDPDLVIGADGRWWLSLGSFWSGLKLIELSPSSGLRANTSLYNLAQRPSSVEGAIEAADIYAHGGYYYLFASFDKCCQGASSTYRIMVGRSATLTGTFVDRNGTPMLSGGGTQVLAGHGSVHGPGHSATLHDVDGDVLFYHYYDNSGAAKLGINLLGWDSAGWPFVY